MADLGVGLFGGRGGEGCGKAGSRGRFEETPGLRVNLQEPVDAGTQVCISLAGFIQEDSTFRRGIEPKAS